jgi:hypothetical protein
VAPRLDARGRKRRLIVPVLIHQGGNFNGIAQRLAIWTVGSLRLYTALTAGTKDAEAPLFLTEFGVRSWALSRVFDREAMGWDGLGCSLGR